MSFLRRRILEQRIAKKKDGLLACYEIIAEHQPKLAALEAELARLRATPTQKEPKT